MNKKSERNIKNNKAANTQVNKTLIMGLLMIGLLIGSVAYILAADFASVGVFDINGKICADGSGIPDWGQCSTTTGTNGIFNATAPLTGLPIASHLPPGTIPGTAFFFNDGIKSADQTMYPGSNKNNQPLSAADCLARGLTGSACAPWAWTSFSSAIQAKNDLSRVYTIGINATQNYPGTLIAKGDELLFIGLERISPSGDSHIDVEIFQSAVGLAQTPPCTLGNPYCQFTGIRENGDIIVTMDFVVGGSLGSVGLRQFNTALNGYGPIVGGFNTTRTSGLICNGAAGTLCAQNNNVTIPAGPWGYLDSKGNSQTTVPANGFTEIGIDITAITGTRPCIATILPKTRSSQSFLATLSDFAGPHQTGACTGHISIAPNKTNEVGTPHTFTVSVTKEINGASSPAVGVIPTVTLTPYNGISASNLTVISNNCPSGTNGAGQCSITFVSNTAGKVNGSATASFMVLNTPITVTTNGTLGNSFPAVKTYVDAFITVSPLKATNEVNTTHTFTFTVKQNDGSGSGYVVVSGATVSWTLTPSNGAVLTTASTGTCTTNGAGQCSVTFGSSQAGTVTVHGSVTLNVGGVSLTRATGDGKSFDSPDATKVFVDAFITVSPLTATNEVNTTHTFTFTVEQNAGTGGGYVVVSGATVSWTLTPSNGAVLTTASSGTCTTNGAGQCTVTFGSTQAGTVKVHGSISLVVSGVTLNRATGDGVSFDSPNATKVFVDAFITVSPLTATNEVNTTHTFTFTVKQNDGSGSGYQLVNGATVMWMLTPSNGAVLTTASSGSCVTGSSATGQCTVTFGSSQAGTVAVHGSVTLTVATVSLTRATGDHISFDSPDAMKVFVDAFITVTPLTATNEVNTTHTFTFTVEENLGTGGGYVVVSGATVSWTLTPMNGATLTSPNAGTCITNGAGQCSVTFTSSSAGTVIVHGSVNLTVSTVPLTRATGDGISFDSPNAVKVFVDAFITVTPQQATNSVGQSHTFTFTVMVNIGDGSGYQPMSGVIVSWTLTNSNGAVASPPGPGTCTTNGAGQCTVTFSSATAGTVTVHGSISIIVSGVTLNRATGDGIGFDSPNAVKIFIAGFISWIKEDNAGNLLAGSTFQLCQIATFDPGTSTFTAITPVCVSVLDNTAPDTNPTGGLFNVTGLGLGNYTIMETQAPPGFSLPNPNPTVTVSLVSGSPSATLTTPFTNPRPAIKLSGFGYTNTQTSVLSQCPPTCTVSGTVVYSLAFTNFGTSTGYMNFTFTVSFLGTGTFSCGANPSANNVAITAGATVSFTMTCTYTNASAGSTVTADLTATYNTGSGDPLIRIVNGTPAEVKFTIQTN